jgi:3-polyprenyl-4-hydroxybenzoate decarboxylase
LSRIIEGFSGANGAIYGLPLLETLSSIEGMEPPPILSQAARITIEHETSMPLDVVEGLPAVQFMGVLTTMTLASSLKDEPWTSPVYYARQMDCLDRWEKITIGKIEPF